LSRWTSERFHSFYDVLSLAHGYVLQVKQKRNEVFHSADFKLSYTELDDYINDMTTLLQDPKQLLTDDKAKEAIRVLQQVTHAQRSGIK